MKKAFGIVLAAIMAMTTLAGCGGSGSSSSSAPAPAQSSVAASESTASEAPAPETFETVKVRLAYMPNMGSASLATVARDKGFFEEMGLSVEMIQFQGGPAEIAAMASGDIDIAQIGHGAHALCAEGEALIFQIDNTSLADAVIGNKDRGINTIADLKGKTIATTAGTSAEIILNLALQSAGLTQADVEVVEMDANGIVSAMIGNSIDACATWSPSTRTITNTLGDKAITLASNADFVDSVTFPSSFITNQKYVDSNRDVLVRFARALQNASNWRKANIEETAKLVAKECETDEAVMLECTEEGNWLTSDFVGASLADGTLKSYYENQQQVFIDSGRLASAVDVNQYVLFDIMQEAFDANKK